MTPRSPLLLVLALATALACAKAPPPNPPLVPLPEGGQIPADVLQQASADHGGSFRSSRDAAPPQARTAAPARKGGIGMVVGPVRAESVPPHVDPTRGDAGQAVRDVIREGMARSTRIALHEAPREGQIEDAPRPDLADRGVRYVVKGTVRYSEEGGPVDVFLRAVDTRSGEVAAAASGQASGPVAAAEQATARLVRNVSERARGGSGIGGTR